MSIHTLKDKDNRSARLHWDGELVLVVGLRIYKAIYFIRHTLGVYGVNATVMFKSEYYKHLEFSGPTHRQ